MIVFYICILVSCDIKELKELDQAKNASECFLILWKEEIITTSNVIAMQFLLQETECEDLERKCVEFAKKQNAIYYYEKPPGITFILYIKIIGTDCIIIFLFLIHRTYMLSISL